MGLLLYLIEAACWFKVGVTRVPLPRLMTQTLGWRLRINHFALQPHILRVLLFPGSPTAPKCERAFHKAVRGRSAWRQLETYRKTADFFTSVMEWLHRGAPISEITQLAGANA